MNAASILAALKSLLPMLEPLVLQEFENAVMPELVKLESGIGSPDLKVIAAALVAAVKEIGEAEVPKI